MIGTKDMPSELCCSLYSVADARLANGHGTSAALYRFQSNEMVMSVVTGTDGKQTKTSTYLYNILRRKQDLKPV